MPRARSNSLVDSTAVRRRWSVAAIVAVLAAVAAVLVAPGRAEAAYTTTLTNFTASGGQVVRFDTAGNAIDAHDGEIALFDGVYYLYGSSYDCGYGLQVVGTPACGFKAYSSTDLVHWTNLGYLFDATTSLWQSRCAPPRFVCYRPHVAFNAATGRYVLWINGYDNASGYHVFTSTSPAGGFVEVAQPTMAVQGTGAGFNNGDMDLFVDDDGTGYIAYTDIRGGHDQIVERLNATYTSGTGSYVRIVHQRTEAPSLFRRGSLYYLVYGPTCAYCGGTNTIYRTASNPLGPWSGTTLLNANSCGGQPSFVAKLGTTYLYGSDLWVGGAKNQATANHFWAPLSFTASGGINPISCVASVAVTLETGSAGGQLPRVDLDQTSGVTGFRIHCDIKGTWRRVQTFTPSRTGVLNGLSLTTFQFGGPNAGLTLEVYRANSPTSLIGSALYGITAPTNTVTWSPRDLTVVPNVPVTAGLLYAVVARSTSTAGCYGFGYNDTGPYPGGGAAYSSNSGATYTAEANRDLKFTTTVGNPNRVRGAAVTVSSTYQGSGWGLANINDGQRRSGTNTMGWTSNDSLATDHGETVHVDFGAVATIGRVVLIPRTDWFNAGQGFPLDFTIEVSTDGSAWTVVSAHDDHPLPWGSPQTFAFTPTEARYLRVAMTSLRGTNPRDPSFRAQLAEIEAY